MRESQKPDQDTVRPFWIELREALKCEDRTLRLSERAFRHRSKTLRPGRSETLVSL